MKVTRVIVVREVLNGALGIVDAPCPAGSIIVGGGFASSRYDVQVQSSFEYDKVWKVVAQNNTGATQYVTAMAKCMSVEPAEAFTTAKRQGLLPASVRKAMKKRGR
jgi:hypothetical protein